MNLLEPTFHESDPKAVSLELENRKRVQAPKRVELRGADGRCIAHQGRTEQQAIDYFWARVNIGGMNECWEWQAGRTSKTQGRDYGVVWIMGKKWKTHVYAFTLVRGPVPTGLFVCHSCDNPPCCNPFHHFAGTPLQNAHDCLSKGRAKKERGEDRYCAKLTEDAVREIRRRFIPRVCSSPMLAREFGVSETAIKNAVSGVRWKHVK